MERISFYRNVTTEEARIRVLFVDEVHGRPRTRKEGWKKEARKESSKQVTKREGKMEREEKKKNGKESMR